jgi:hypothetical protein
MHRNHSFLLLLSLVSYRPPLRTFSCSWTVKVFCDRLIARRSAVICQRPQEIRRCYRRTYVSECPEDPWMRQTWDRTGGVRKGTLCLITYRVQTAPSVSDKCDTSLLPVFNTTKRRSAGEMTAGRRRRRGRNRTTGTLRMLGRWRKDRRLIIRKRDGREGWRQGRGRDTEGRERQRGGDNRQRAN